MPRIRSIKPQFWIDEDLAKVSREVRLLYIGLWNICDDSGVFEWRPARIKAQLFPNDNDLTPDIIESWLTDLKNIGNVKVISENGSSFGYIPTFLKHQDIFKPSQWRYLTKPLPVGEEYDTSIPPVGEQSVKEKEKEKEKIKDNILSGGYAFKIFESNFQKITETNSQQLNDLIDAYGVEKVIEALKIAIKRNKRSLAYVEGILKPKEVKKNLLWE